MANATASPFRRLNLRYIQMTDKEMMALLHQNASREPPGYAFKTQRQNQQT